MSNYSWRKLSSKQLLNHPRVPLREDTVRLLDGKEVSYAILELPDAVTVIIRKNDKFLLNLEYTYPVDDTIHRPADLVSDGMLYKFPGGTLKPGESYEAAAKREVEEETGLKITNITLLAAVRNFFPRSNSRDYKVVAEISGDGTKQLDREESGMQQVWKSAQDIDDLIRAKDPRVLHSHFLDAWALYKIHQS